MVRLSMRSSEPGHRAPVAIVASCGAGRWVVSVSYAMFGFFKRQPRQPKATSDQNYRAEFQSRTRALYDKFAVEDTPYDQLLDAMSAVEDEMNRNGGCNWNTGDYGEFLEVIRQHLTTDTQFSRHQMERISWALDEIAACGKELENDGESGRAIEEPIEYLIARVVDWCRTHEPESRNDT